MTQNEGRVGMVDLIKDTDGKVIPREGDHYNPKPEVFTGKHIYPPTVEIENLGIKDSPNEIVNGTIDSTVTKK
jgi:hypothetical protein